MGAYNNLTKKNFNLKNLTFFLIQKITKNLNKKILESEYREKKTHNFLIIFFFFVKNSVILPFLQHLLSWQHWRAHTKHSLQFKETRTNKCTYVYFVRMSTRHLYSRFCCCYFYIYLQEFVNLSLRWIRSVDYKKGFHRWDIQKFLK